VWSACSNVDSSFPFANKSNQGALRMRVLMRKNKTKTNAP